MHSCGHDCHATVMLGVARQVVESGLLKTIRGRLKFIFQPAEEIVAGARLMVDAGVLERPKVDRILALHMNTDLSMGQVGLYTGVSHAHTDSFRLVIQGKGVHGAHPHDGIDPIVAGAHFVSALQSIVGRNLDPRDAGVVTVGQFQAGTAPNIIPDQALLRGTVRTFKTEVREIIMRRLQDLAASLQPAFRVTVDYQFIPGVPSTINDEAVAADLHQAAVAGPRARRTSPTSRPRWAARISASSPSSSPGRSCGSGAPTRREASPHKGHSPHFDVDERALAHRRGDHDRGDSQPTWPAGC